MPQTLIDWGAPRLSSGILAMACLGVAVALFRYWYLQRGTRAPSRNIAALGGVIAVAAGTHSLLDLLAFWLPAQGGLMSGTRVAVAGLALLATVALWSRLSQRGKRPLAADVADANQRLTECRRELADVKHRFDTALAGSRLSMAQQDRDLRYIWEHIPSAEQSCGARLGDSLPAPPPHPIVAAKRQVLETGIATRQEVALHQADKTLWFDARIEPIYADGVIVGITTVALDVTRYKLYEQHLQNLLRELSHRSKNLLAVVQGIAQQTGATDQTLPEYLDRFSARLQALSGAHDLLINRAWHGADLRDLVVREVGQDLATLEARLSIHGDVTIVDPEAAQNIAMGLHEMASNAYRYGALQSPHGRVVIAWQRIEIDGHPLVELTWVESNGPSVEPPARAGFGRSLLERLVPRALEGTSELIFAPTGVRWTLRFPASRLEEPE